MSAARYLFLTWTAVACASLPVAAHADKVPLGEAAMRSIHGGLLVESFTNPAASFQVVNRDNMQLSGSIAEALNANSVVISVFAGDSKIGSQVVSTGAPGSDGLSRATFSFRSAALSDFPIGDRAGKNLSVRFLVPSGPDRNTFATSCNPNPNVGCILPAGNSGNFPRNGITLDDNVIVNRVRIINVSDGFEASFLDPAQFPALIDNLEFAQDRLFSPSIDNVLAQCPNERRVQLRLDNNYNAAGFLNVPSGCARLSTCPGGFEFFDQLAAQDPGIFHIFVLNDLDDDEFQGVIGLAFVGASNFVTIRQNLDPVNQSPLLTASVTAHEIGHTRGLEHFEGDCQEIFTEPARRGRNLMCPFASNPFFSNGRLVGGATFLTPGQCASILRETAFPGFPLATDIN